MREAATKASFIIIHGMRTKEAEAQMVAGGHSQTMHSRHLPNEEGFCCAVDVAALVDGHISWQPTDYLPVNNAVQAAAKELGVPVEWGGSWTTLKDWGHFQLPWGKYP